LQTTHKIYYQNSNVMQSVASGSVDLVVTSPPYPMIAMWDEMFIKQNPPIKKALENGKGYDAFKLMHKTLDKVWNECYRILKNGGFACINIGDATRTVNGNFMLYPNHSRILQHLLEIGFTSLPAVLWRKQTNAPNKFMGSGMLPAGAYVTLEHEYILIVRKGEKREFIKAPEKHNRHASALFWEERNIWFSDVWMDLKGTTQKLRDDTVRIRSAAYPFELPFRLINMYSAKKDIVADPFFGIGTTMLAGMTAGRNTIGFEIEQDFSDAIHARTLDIVNIANQRIADRIAGHIEFVNNRIESGRTFKHINENYNFPVITNQEKKLLLNNLKTVNKIEKNTYEAVYFQTPRKEFSFDREAFTALQDSSGRPPAKTKKTKLKKSRPAPVQLKLPG